ncbi:MAG: BamA/TamA family outer membrane protein [Acidobacteria bacterium]|nr:BamA/TamA family outer membrane protein [Acidobacteriota bacterium]
MINSSVRRIFLSATFSVLFVMTTFAQSNPQTNGSTTNNTPAATPQGGISQVSNIQERVQSRDRNAPYRESGQAIKIVKHVNALFAGLSHGAGMAFGVEATTADVIPAIEFRAKAVVSTRLYRRFMGEAYIPKLFNENTHADVSFSYTRRTKDNFFGIGPRTPESLETNFSTEERAYTASIYHDFARGLQSGVFAQLTNAVGFLGEDEKDQPIDVLFSGNPAVVPVTNWLPGFNSNAKIVSYGAFVELDRRNNARGLTQGGYFYTRIASFDGLNNGSAFSDYGWNEIELDGRGYIPLGSNSTSLALRGYSDLKNPRGGSQIPFYQLANLGGRAFGRGFTSYRFRGNNSLLLTVEPRQTVWKKDENRGIDVFAFGDAGQVWGDNRSQIDPQVLANDKFDAANWRFGIGGGLQYRMSKGFAARVDLGHSNETTRVDISVGRGF